jgi:UDP-N-acetylmuramyl pentapeptide phosphotransferase/UDP-N-acetylglucosamine-1-phosphate transferase
MPSFVVATVISTLTTLAVAAFLRHRAILDHPNDRSLHEMPKPRGGGWGIAAGMIAGCLILGPTKAQLIVAWPLAAGALALMAVSWLDDLKPLPPLPRFGVQLAVVALGTMRLSGYVFQGWLPEPLDHALTAIIWLWFINLFNFMDGMDGLAGIEGIAIAFGLFLITPEHASTMVLVGAILGFLVWNWSPSRIFMGDVGSIPLGYLLAYLLFRAAENGHWLAVVILPLYFLVDASFTLLKRLARREKVWKAHREHFYQQAVQAGHSHRTVAIAVCVADAALAVAAVWLVPNHPYAAIDLAGIAVIGLLAWMKLNPS